MPAHAGFGFVPFILLGGGILMRTDNSNPVVLRMSLLSHAQDIFLLVFTSELIRIRHNKNQRATHTNIN